MINWLQSFVSALRNVDLGTAASLLIPLVPLGLCMVCLHEGYAKYRARRLPPGVSGLRCLLEIPNEKVWLKMLKFNRQYGMPSHDHEVRCR